MTLTDGESRALLTSTLIVALAALGRTLLGPAVPAAELHGLSPAGDVDSALVVAESLQAEAERRRRPLAPDERIDVNLAGEVELDRLPGIGPALARAIVRHRQVHGPFHSPADLEQVPGLGSSTVGRVAAHTSLAPTGGVDRDARESGSAAGPRVNVNRASARQLERLPGIGPAKANAIIRWRRENGSFERLEGLLEVPGIGPATLERLRAHALIGP